MISGSAKDILDNEIQRGEEVLYLFEGPVKKRYFPKVNEFWMRIFTVLYSVGYGVLLGWIFFRADSETRVSLLSIIIIILVTQLVGRFFSLGPFKKIDIFLSNFELSAVTDRRVLIFDRNERIFNIPLNDFEAASPDSENGAKVIRLSKKNKFQDILDTLIPDTQTPSLLPQLQALIRSTLPNKD